MNQERTPADSRQFPIHAMRKAGPPCSPDHLARHYSFELLSLRMAHRLSETHAEGAGAGPALSFTTIDFCLHARVLMTFFAGRPGSSTPMVADAFVEDFVSGIAFDERLQQLGARLDQQIHHLHHATEARALTRSERAALVDAIEQDHQSFLSSLPSAYRTAIQSRCR